MGVYFLKTYIYTAILILTLCLPHEAKGTTDKNGKEIFKILVIHSYNQTLGAYSQFDKLLHEKLEKEQIYSSLPTFYVDCERYDAADEEARMYSFLDTLSFKPDIIISIPEKACRKRPRRKCSNVSSKRTNLHKVPGWAYRSAKPSPNA